MLKIFITHSSTPFRFSLSFFRENLKLLNNSSAETNSRENQGLGVRVNVSFYLKMRFSSSQFQFSRPQFFSHILQRSESSILFLPKNHGLLYLDRTQAKKSNREFSSVFILFEVTNYLLSKLNLLKYLKVFKIVHFKKCGSLKFLKL